MVTPYSVTSVDYTRLISEFGTQLLDTTLLDRIERLTHAPVHPFLKRGIFFSHRSLDELLTSLESPAPAPAPVPFYLYTGRGPSSESLHLGHLIPMIMTKYLQEAFQVPLVLQLTDDEKFLFRDLTLEQIAVMTRENIKDILAVGFDPAKTFIFSNLEYVGTMYPTIVRIQKCLTTNQVKSAFGLTDSDNIGRLAFPAIQAAPSFSASFPTVLSGQDRACLIPCAIDQDPFFRLTRDVAPRLHYRKPAVLHSKFFPGLKGVQTKMSSSDPTSAIFLTDTPEQIETKIQLYAFSGGRATLREHRDRGADLEIDVPYQYLKIFLPQDDRLAEITQAYGSGRMTTREIKAETTRVIVDLVRQHQERRSQITEAQVQEVMRVRRIV
jgi:tryptophanyl-tRNA synthetase